MSYCRGNVAVALLGSITLRGHVLCLHESFWRESILAGNVAVALLGSITLRGHVLCFIYDSYMSE